MSLHQAQDILSNKKTLKYKNVQKEVALASNVSTDYEIVSTASIQIYNFAMIVAAC